MFVAFPMRSLPPSLLIFPRFFIVLTFCFISSDPRLSDLLTPLSTGFSFLFFFFVFLLFFSCVKDHFSMTFFLMPHTLPPSPSSFSSLFLLTFNFFFSSTA